MKNWSSAISVIVILLIAGCGYDPSEHGTAGEPGFREAFFDSDLLEDLMDDKKCVVIRFYSIRRSADDVSGSAMAMSSDLSGEDRYSWWFGPWYKAYEELRGDGADFRNLKVGDAEEATRFMRDAGYTPIAANFKKEEIRTVLALKSCNGVQLLPELTPDGRLWTMRLIPVEIKDGTATRVGDREDELVATEPCPTFCGGRPEYYVNMR
ncbi:MAG: hypothetical protein IPI81_14425 [Flavobacteriales bacterium]|nr:hypothetical protein [Flavobacteriales bacterium]MCC6937868.1 hypothetical protein [Flavobacteriales bacterium]